MSAGEERWERGRAAMDAIYGAGFSDRYPVREDVQPYSRHTVETLFADVWIRPGLSVRDRRLLVLGTVSMLGRPDLVTIQVLGGLRAGAFTEEQLREAVLQLAFYCGWPNATALNQGVDADHRRVPHPHALGVRRAVVRDCRLPTAAAARILVARPDDRLRRPAVISMCRPGRAPRRRRLRAQRRAPAAGRRCAVVAERDTRLAIPDQNGGSSWSSGAGGGGGSGSRAGRHRIRSSSRVPWSVSGLSRGSACSGGGSGSGRSGRMGSPRVV
jgi:4-carboxymuconolactone decarboxylase